MILVMGAAGKTGLAIIKALARRGYDIRALVHRPAQVKRAIRAGADETVIGDMRDEVFLQESMLGILKVYHICPNVSPEEFTIGQKVIRAAVRSRIQHFVYHSVLHPQVEAMPHHWLKMRVEEALFESNLTYTILQPAPYMQNILAVWEAISSEGRYPVPYPVETRLSLVDIRDVAEVASTIFATSDHYGAIYELCGPDALDQREVAVTLTRGLGLSVRAEQIDRAAWAVSARARGVGEYQVRTLLQMFEYYERHGLVGNPNALSWLLGRTGTSFANFVEEVIAQVKSEEGQESEANN